MLNAALRKKLNITALVLTLILCAIFMFACNKPSFYAQEHNFEVEVSDTDDALEFAPKGCTPTFGFVLYTGFSIEAKYYSYLGNALAKQGFLVVIPKHGNTLNDYIVNEPAFARHAGVRFAIGGHDSGGGVAVRHAMEYGQYGNYIKGVALYAPVDFSRPQYDAQGHPIYDENNNMVLTHYSISSLNTPTLLLETDTMRPDDLKNIAKEHLNANATTEHVLTSSISKEFCENSAEDENAIAQRNETVKLTLAFLRSLATKK